MIHTHNVYNGKNLPNDFELDYNTLSISFLLYFQANACLKTFIELLVMNFRDLIKRGSRGAARAAK